MKIKHLRLKNFRSHKFLELGFKKGITLIHGDNGSGKTNILEAIHMAALTKNFLSVLDSDCLSLGCDSFEIEALFESDIGVTKKSRVFFSKREKKKFSSMVIP